LLINRHVGTVDTDHHNVALRIKSVLDAMEDQAAQLPEVEGAGSQQVGWVGGWWPPCPCRAGMATYHDGSRLSDCMLHGCCRHHCTNKLPVHR
jgi:hypothetical protein